MPPPNLHSVSVRTDTFNHARAVSTDHRLSMSEAIGVALATFAKLPESVREKEVKDFLRARYERAPEQLGARR